jgi:hypothetical protein
MAGQTVSSALLERTRREDDGRQIGEPSIESLRRTRSRFSPQPASYPEPPQPHHDETEEEDIPLHPRPAGFVL